MRVDPHKAMNGWRGVCTCLTILAVVILAGATVVLVVILWR